MIKDTIENNTFAFILVLGKCRLTDKGYDTYSYLLWSLVRLSNKLITKAFELNTTRKLPPLVSNF